MSKRKDKKPTKIEVMDADEQIERDDNDDARDRIGELEDELAEAQAARQRALADYANFQRRSVENERRASRDGSASVAKSLLPVIDNFDLTLNQNAEKITVEQLMGGVRLIREELIKALNNHGVTRFEPQQGEAFDPMQHEALMRQPSSDVEPNAVVQCLQPGYKLGDTVLRAAQVSVATAPEQES